MYAKYGDDANNEYLEKRLFSAVRMFCLENFWKVMQR